GGAPAGGAAGGAGAGLWRPARRKYGVSSPPRAPPRGATAPAPGRSRFGATRSPPQLEPPSPRGAPRRTAAAARGGGRWFASRRAHPRRGSARPQSTRAPRLADRAATRRRQRIWTPESTRARNTIA